MESDFHREIDIEAEVLRRFDLGLKIDLIAWQLNISLKRVELILMACGRL